MNKSIASELNHVLRTCWVVQWISAMGTWVQSLVREGLACHGAAVPGATVTEARLSRAAHCPAEPGAAAT